MTNARSDLSDPSLGITTLPATLDLPAGANAVNAPSVLTRALVRAGILSPAQETAIDNRAQSTQQTSRCTVIDAVLQTGCITSAALARFCADTFGYARQDLAQCDPNQCPLDLIDARLMQCHTLAPLAIDGKRLTVAISDPSNLQALDQIKFQTQLTITPVVVDHYALLALIGQLIGRLSRPTDLHVFDDGSTDAATASTAAANPVDDAPVVRFLQKILDDAVAQRASDLHFEPFEKFCRIRFRVDGVLHEIAQPPLAIRDQLASRIKVISNLDIAEKRVPQDGRMRLCDAARRAIDCRVSTMPTLFGEKIVIRLLESGRTELGIDTLGLEAAQSALLMEAIHRPHGMILVTGPVPAKPVRSMPA